jgi:hypothetical protein
LVFQAEQDQHQTIGMAAAVAVLAVLAKVQIQWLVAVTVA